MTSDFSGDWYGVLDTGTAKAKLAFRIAADTAWLHTQSRGDLPLALERRGERIAFATPAFDLALDLGAEGGGLTGTCRHAGTDFPVAFVRGTPPPSLKMRRPQTPAGPFPYGVETVTFAAADGARLAGTLTLPPAPGPHPAVVLSCWYGRADRDQTLAGHKPFAIWADALSRRGLATLRYDKRGTGRSEGDFDRATTGDFTADLARAVALLRARPEIDDARIGLMGHSEGGHLSADAAAADPSIAFCVMMTPSGRPEAETFGTELFRAAMAVGGVPIAPEQRLALGQKLAEAERTANSAREAQARVRGLLSEAARTGQFAADRIEWRTSLAASPWRRWWLAYDHTAGLRALTCPLLVVFAERDLQTAPAWHAPPIETALAGKPRATIVTLAGLNHFLQQAVTGAPSEYADIPQTIAPEAVATVCDWITGVARAGATA